MSAKLRIPSQHVKPLADFVRLSPQDRHAFLEAVEREEPTVNLDILGDRVAETSGLHPDTIRNILDLLVTLHGAREGLGLSLQEMVAELRHAMEVLNKPEVTPEDWGRFEDDISALLAPEGTLALTSKAVTVMREHAQVYFHGRVLTDLRPIFGPAVDEPPAALVTIHTLKLVYHHAGELLEFFVAMDRNDVNELIETLGRALKKEDSLRGLTESNAVTLLEVKR